ncbi:MAG: 30S ribosomal protein S8 [Bdellovibrionales bacterium]|nr:30S ribosomal protein S8 [Bdellovibrionales bacterium]
MDTVGDFCTCIRNAVRAGKDKVDVPKSKLRESIAEKLKQYGYIRGYRTAEDGRQGLMRLYLKYDQKNCPKIQDIQRVSKPSRRFYTKVDDVPEIRSGYGLSILSTNQGILSHIEAKKQNVGGEILCQVW